MEIIISSNLYIKHLQSNSGEETLETSNIITKLALNWTCTYSPRSATVPEPVQTPLHFQKSWTFIYNYLNVYKIKMILSAGRAVKLSWIQIRIRQLQVFFCCLTLSYTEMLTCSTACGPLVLTHTALRAEPRRRSTLWVKKTSPLSSNTVRFQ